MKILIAAGGTGGHLFPTLAVVDKLKNIYKEKITFHFFGRTDKIEGKIIPTLGYKLHATKLTGLVSSVSLQTLKMPFHLLKSILQLKKLIINENIDAVLCAGAYLSVPAGLACRLCGKKLFLMESNVNPGKAIKLLASSATKIYTSFDETENYFDNDIKTKIRNFGNPVRQDIVKSVEVSMESNNLQCQTNETSQIAKSNSQHTSKGSLLVFGGSLGAKAINDAMLRWLDNFSKTDYKVLWQTGSNFDLNAKLPSNIKIVPFIDDMASAYADADLVVARSGATTIAELCVVGKPAILVPLPSASTGEQYLNAKYLQDHNAAIVINNEDILDNLYPIIESLMNDKERLLNMSEALKSLAKPNACSKIATDMLEEIMK